jgi:hypothetical protein
MGSSLTNGPCDYGEVYEIDRQPYTVVCPQLPGTKPNLPQGACDERLAMRKVPRCCRKCKGIESAPKVKRKKVTVDDVTVENPSLTPCECGNDRESGHVYCPKCRAVKELKRKEYRKAWNIANLYKGKPKLCGICKCELVERKYKFCDACRPEADRLAKIKANERRVLYRKQQRETK